MKKVIVAGSRGINHLPTVTNIINTALHLWLAAAADNWKDWYRPEIVSGGAHGVDSCAERYALKCGFKCTVFPAKWDEHGKGAGFIRNKEMADYADALIAIWDGESKGTQHMIKTMEALGKPVYLYKTDDY